jgi:AAA+ ATPase superfamily predicted ATPase
VALHDERVCEVSEVSARVSGGHTIKLIDDAIQQSHLHHVITKIAKTFRFNYINPNFNITVIDNLIIIKIRPVQYKNGQFIDIFDEFEIALRVTSREYLHAVLCVIMILTKDSYCAILRKDLLDNIIILVVHELFFSACFSY